MPGASPTKSARVHVGSHSGFGPPRLVLAVRRPDHTQLSQSLLYRISWHEADSVAQHDSWSLNHLGYLYPGTTPVMIKLDHNRSCPWV